MSVAEMNASSLLDKMKTLPEDVQVKLGYMIEGAVLLATSRTNVDDPPKSAGERRKSERSDSLAAGGVGDEHCSRVGSESMAAWRETGVYPVFHRRELLIHGACAL